MPLIDNELVNDQKDLKVSNISIGDYIFGRIQNNIVKYGDGLWMVRKLQIDRQNFHNGEICTARCRNW